VLVLHALTGDSHVVGEAGPGHPTPGWWGHLIGPGGLLDTDRWFVVAPNILGGCQGSTGPASAAPDGQPWGSRFPRLTTRDQVAAEVLLADLLGIDRWALVLGGSAGGMRAVEWAVTVPDRVQRLLLLATTAATSADQIAWCHTQVKAITSDPAWAGGDFPRSRGNVEPYGPVGGPFDEPVDGLAVARQIAHITYRSAEDFWREIDQVRAVVEVVVPALVAGLRGAPLRIWSVPCASGEEPLTIAMVLDQAGWFGRAPIEIHGSDASPAQIARARAGHYRQRAFRALPEALRERYFRQHGDSWIPDAGLANRISSWSVVNLMAAAEVAAMATAPVIFCRNVFIYFSVDRVRDVAERFAAAMPVPAYLCVAASESLLRVTDAFQLEEIGGSFVYVKR
jgi:homoserine acetyltransferase